MKKLFITTPIYYASGKPHIGHAYTTIMADIIAKYKRALGYEVFFLTGMDEHGQKIQETAKKNNKTIDELLYEVSSAFKQLWRDLNVDYDAFVRTTDPKHEQAVKRVFSMLLEKNYVYLGEWKGLYCVSCEENYTKDQATEKDGKLYCRVGHELSERSETTYFLKVSQFSDWIKQQWAQEYFIIPKTRITELTHSFLDKGLEDLSITRQSRTWGIPTIENPGQVIYVWIDALLSYLTGLGYLSDNDENFKKFWMDPETQIVHLMSKEITRFHCIYWPILLKMLGLRQPSHIISHNWIVTKEGKMSKSLGNIINPYDVINRFGVDAFRYFIVRQISIEKDGVFSEEQFIETYNSHLANNYGNMATRLAGMLQKYCDNVVPPLHEEALTEKDKAVKQAQEKLVTSSVEYIENFNINGLLNAIQAQYDVLNKYIEDTKPWELAKDPNKRNQLENHLNILFTSAIDLMTLQAPILSRTSDVVETAFRIPLLADRMNKNWAGHRINGIDPLFVRIEKK